MDYTMLVNSENPIDETFKVESLVPVGKSYSTSEGGYTDKDILLEEKTAQEFQRMIDAVNAVQDSEVVIPDSGYRSYQKQVEVMDYYINKEGLEAALKRVAMPGTSEHHTGLAIDIAIFDKDGNYLDDVTGKEVAIAWLHQHAPEYGFILRYPEGKEEITGVRSEPWHFRYVGRELAMEIAERGITLEEYYEHKKSL